MSFGFSVGDFLAVGRLAQDIISCLQDVGGAKSDYQELIRELECLQRAVHHLDKLQNKSPSTNLDSIKYAALICRQPLEEFLRKIQKYDKSLGVWTKEGTIKTAVDKIRFGFGHKEEIRKLQNYLDIHVGIINVTLAEYGLEQMDLATSQAAAEHLHIRERLEDTRSMIAKIGGNVSLQTLVVQNTHSMLNRLFQTLTGELSTTWAALADLVAKVFVSTQQTHGVVQEIRSSLTDTFTRMPYFQDPLVVEDALGFKFPFPSEYDFDLLEMVIKRRFVDGPGSLEVEAGNYEIVQTRNSNNVLSKSSRLLPGMAVTMAIIILRPTFTDEACPMPGCGSCETISPPGGGRVCSSCGVWFSSTGKSRQNLSHLLAAVSAMSKEEAAEDRGDTEERPSKRVKLAAAEENVTLFRNVRIAPCGEPQSQNSNLRGPYVESTTDYDTRVHITNGQLDVIKIWRRAVQNSAREPQELPFETLPRKRKHSTTSSLLEDPPVRQFNKSTSTSQSNKVDKKHAIVGLECDTISYLEVDSDEEDEIVSNDIYRLGRGPVEYEEAISLVNAIKRRYSRTPKVYRQFLKTLQRYQRENQPFMEVYPKIFRLFSSEPDLIEGLKRFLDLDLSEKRAKLSEASG